MGMTVRYTHLSPKHQLGAVERLDRYETGTSTGTEDDPAPAEITDSLPTLRAANEKEWPGAELNRRHRDFQSAPERRERQGFFAGLLCGLRT